MARPAEDALAAYRARREPSRTPEPFGTPRPGRVGPGAPGRFVVQKHAARRLHFDFRLELGGVLKSWAVPKGPSADPADKRLAVAVEDHPIEYANFEGVIPAGEYGAGPVIVWDRGAWTPLGDPEAALAAGDLKFRLDGYKLRGEWVLVRTRATKEWLLIKHRDAFADPGGARAPGDASILSGLGVDEVAQAGARGAQVAAEAERLGAPRQRVDARAWRPMLATPREEPFSGDGWLFELKVDGYRALCAKEGRSAAIFHRSGEEATARYPEIALALRSLPCERALLDGEIAVLDAEGRPDFQALQGRAGPARGAERAALLAPATLFAFDLLALDGLDLSPLPLASRKALLARIAPGQGPVRFLDHVLGRGEDLFREVEARGLEGMVAKRADAPYRPGRSPAWQKVRRERTGDFAVVGFTAPGGAGRVGLGALHLAAYDAGRLLYVGSVGSGIDDRLLAELRAALEPRRRPRPACEGPVPRGREHAWVEPTLVCEVRYHELTSEGLLRQPVFLSMREDKRVEECGHPEPAGSSISTSTSNPPLLQLRRQSRRSLAPPSTAPTPAEPSRSRAPAPGRDETRPGVHRDERGQGSRGGAREVKKVPSASTAVSADLALSNLDKVYFPEDGITKGDLLSYYQAVAPFMLPYLRDRPLVLTRFPDGIHGKSFYQQDAPAWRPGWMRTVRAFVDEGAREIDHFVADDERALLYLVNLGAIPIHVWASRAPELGRPDWTILDLDPKGAPFAHVARLARALHDLCEEIGLPSFVKTSGQSGLHVLVPLGGACTHAQAQQLAALLARAVADAHPEIATLARSLGARRGRVYLDTLQNGQGKTIAAPLCVRPRPGAPVSTPLGWSEVRDALEPARLGVRSVLRRLAGAGDPMAPLLGARPDLVAALSRLSERLAGAAGRERKPARARRGRAPPRGVIPR